MGVQQAFCVQPLSKDNCFIFHTLSGLYMYIAHLSRSYTVHVHRGEHDTVHV